MKRREFIKVVGGVVATYPLTTSAQNSTIPVIGILSGASPGPMANMVVAFHRGLKEMAFIEGQNVAIEYRWADGHYDRLPVLAAELVRRRVAVIAALNPPASLAAKAATTTIPIVFTGGSDPVASGLVASFNRPGKNATGVYVLSNSLEAKRLELLHELIPQASLVAVLVNPKFSFVAGQLKEVNDAAQVKGVKLLILNASTASDIDTAFVTLIQNHINALLVASDPLFVSQREKLVALANRHAIAAIYSFPEFAKAGGLMSYGTNLADAYRQVGIYVGRILKGEKPAELPIHQSVKVELTINLKTAKILGITIPLPLLGRADEVIE